MKVMHIDLKEYKPSPRHSTGQQTAIQLGHPRSLPGLWPHLCSAPSPTPWQLFPLSPRQGPDQSTTSSSLSLKLMLAQPRKDKQLSEPRDSGERFKPSHRHPQALQDGERGVEKRPTTRHEEKKTYFFTAFVRHAAGTRAAPGSGLRATPLL